MSGCVRRYFCPNKSVSSSGCRSAFHYPNGGSYSGYWLNNKNHGFGQKVSQKRQPSDFAGKKQPEGQLVYTGVWKGGKRDGAGTMLRKRGTDLQTIYSGGWFDDMKFGKGKQFYPDGSVYFGEWAKNRRDGVGIQWYANGDIYLGDWQSGYRHGMGVLFYANGNRYEGCFARGYKNGEGTFYHVHTGQVQKGVWENDNARVSLMLDDPKLRCGDAATPYPIPRSELSYPNEIVRDLFQQFMKNSEKPYRHFLDLVNLEFVHRQRHFASFEERLATASGLVIHPKSTEKLF
ncbi:hypothetical protein KR093_003925 [Drosophila rubida]|uniref:MORN repeat-containing protein 3 n=1 Tax=Drosophila rubida TaxID=30044 RepID=A0AAD4JSP6_9MUSC|nr:hypothetical protein KR093_003925 [Drosophila rubida]